ncbi:hypothetical protein [Desulfocurvibacter africanus]
MNKQKTGVASRKCARGERQTINQECAMEFKENDLPIELHHEDSVRLGGGETIRFEANGEAKDVFIGDAFTPTIQLFPDTDYTFNSGDKQYQVRAHFEDKLSVKRL